MAPLVALALFCVEVDRANVDAANLISAITARIARKQVRVARCGDETPTWQLTVEAEGEPESLRFELAGPEVQAIRTIAIGGMTPEEVVQYLSVTAAEAVRPSMDKLLATMGLLEPADDPAAALESTPTACAETAPCPEPRVEIRRVEVPVAPSPAFAVALGPVFAISERPVSLFLQLGTGLESDLFYAGVHAGVRWIPATAGEGEVRLRVWEVEAALEAGLRFAMVRIGLAAQGRLSIADPSGAPTLPDRLQYFWTGGFALSSTVDLWTADSFQLRVLARAAFWPQPHRFQVEGEPVLTQSYLEFLIGPELVYGETFSNRAASDQPH